jgi:putative aminopeptidase FrvX
MIARHIDEISFIVKLITDEGLSDCNGRRMGGAYDAAQRGH